MDEKIINKILKEIYTNKNNEKAKILARFFKTGKGEYGEGDKFLGITVPISRKIASKYKNIELKDIEKLIQNKYHEVRLIAILVLVYKYKINDKKEKQKIYNFYLKNTKYINSWDLVDISSHHIVGDYILNNKSKKSILYKLIESKDLWERRIAIIATFAFINNKDYDLTIKLCSKLMNDKHDLIQKACGWMLREIGKKIGESVLIKFLDQNSHKMPRTMLRYSIERLEEKKRQYYLKKTQL